MLQSNLLLFMDLNNMLYCYLILIGFIFGNLCQLQQSKLYPSWLILIALVTIILLIVMALLIKARLNEYVISIKLVKWHFDKLAIFFLALALGFVWSNWRANLIKENVLPNNLINQTILVTGKIIDLPSRLSSGWRFKLQVTQAYQLKQQDQGEWQLTPINIPNKLQLMWYSHYQPFIAFNKSSAINFTGKSLVPDLQPGQQWLLPIKLKPVHGNLNLGGFDYELHMWRQGVTAIGSVVAKQYQNITQLNLAQLVTDEFKPKIAYQITSMNNGQFVAKFRQYLVQRIHRFMPHKPKAASIIATLTVGAQSELSSDDWQLFRTTGIVHLVSISGLHITMFAYLAIGLVKLIWRQIPSLCLVIPAQKIGLIIGCILAISYAIISGFAVPAQRTTIMLVFFVILKLNNCKWPISLILLATMVLVVLGDPWALLQAGFWLSFIATATLFTLELDKTKPKVFSSISLQFPTEHKTVNYLSGIPAKVYFLVKEQFSISLVLIPLTIWFFQMTSWIGLLVNLIAIPLVSSIVTPLAMLGILAPIFWQVCAWLIDWLYWFSQIAASLPLATSDFAQPPWYLMLLSLLGAGLVILPLALYWRLIGIAMIVLMLNWQPQRPQIGEFKVDFLDVGQGVAVVVLTNKHALLYGAGPAYSSQTTATRVIVPYLINRNIKLDLMLLAQPSLAYIAGAYEILTLYPHLSWIGSMPVKHKLQRLKPMQQLCSSEVKWSWDAVEFEILYPQVKDYAGVKTYGKQLSCVVKISNGKKTVILLGDLPSRQELLLLQRYKDQADKLKADGILVSNHGSKNSTTQNLLQAVKANWAVISAGYLNRFKHPHAEVIQRLEQFNVQTKISYECGMFSWYSYKAKQLLCLRDKNRKYWQQKIRD